MGSVMVDQRQNTASSIGTKDDAACQVCKLDSYLRPDIKLLVSLCYHRICTGCIERVFRHGSAPCPVCEKPIRKIDLQAQKFEDMYVEREIRIRKKVLRILNKRETDFQNTTEYNDYLEFVEDLVYNLVNDLEVQKTNDTLERYRRENQAVIARNTFLEQQENQAVHTFIEQEKERKERLMESYREELVTEGQARRLEKESLLNELASSSREAEKIVDSYKSAIVSSGSIARAPDLIRAGKMYEFAGTAAATHLGYWNSNEAVPPASEMAHFDDPLHTLQYNAAHEQCYDLRDNYHDPYFENIRRRVPYIRAAGYHVGTSYMRALETAYLGLLVSPRSDAKPACVEVKLPPET